jgi:Tfp pilus assembly protein PilO
MPRSFKPPIAAKLGEWIPPSFSSLVKDPRIVMRAIIAVLLVVNIAAAVIAFKPFGGSAEDLRRERADSGRRLAQLQARLAQTRQLVDKVELARREGDDFLAKYFTDRRTTYSTIIEELDRTAQAAGLKLRNYNGELNEIEGSDTLQMMSLNTAYEGDYAGLEKFINLLDKSPRFLIVDSMQAAPQQNGQTLTITLRLLTFVKEAPETSS